MRVVLSVDMEGISQLRDLREILACCPAYWQTGRRRLVADTVAAAEGLLAGGATEVVVLDNHGSGNPVNVRQDELPVGARLETWNVFDLPEHDVDAMLQVGYHARGGVDGFVPHTYIPRLRIRVGDELISESHGRAWAAGVPLLGIVGNDAHAETLGSLEGTPYLVVQRSQGRSAGEPVFDEPSGLDAIRAFAEERLRGIADVPPLAAPARTAFEARLPDRSLGVVDLGTWADAREPIAAAMSAALEPFVPLFAGLDLTSEERVAAQPPERLAAMEQAFVDWIAVDEPEWF